MDRIENAAKDETVTSTSESQRISIVVWDRMHGHDVISNLVRLLAVTKYASPINWTIWLLAELVNMLDNKQIYKNTWQ